MIDKPDFAALRAERDAAIQQIFEAVCVRLGHDPKQMLLHVSPSGCYCACPNGPCEHQFTNWRDFGDGTGGEQFCQLCGMGAMSHSLRTSE